MSVVAVIHEVIGGLLIVACLLAFAWALAISRRHRPLPPLYWQFVRMSMGGLLGLQVITGVLLLALGAHMPTPLHWMYAAFLVVGFAIFEMMRPGSNMRDVVATAFMTRGPFDEARVGWILMLVIAVLAMRAYMTGALGF